jgi:hypothetical protein
MSPYSTEIREGSPPTAALGHVWTAPAVQEESDFSAKRSGAAMYSACCRVEYYPVTMQPVWLLALM